MKRNGAATDAKLAPFVAVEAAPVDAEMWPVHPGAWLEPDLPPQIPAGSGLRAERRYSIPAPHFVRQEPEPADLPATVAAPPECVLPQVHAAVPEHDLAPLGWDPRVICRRGDR